MNRLEVVDQQNFGLLSKIGSKIGSKLASLGKAGTRGLLKKTATKGMEEIGIIALMLAICGGIVWLGMWLEAEEAKRIAAMERNIIRYRKQNPNCSMADISGEYGYDYDTIARVLTYNDLLTKRDEEFLRKLQGYRDIQKDKLEIERMKAEISKASQTSEALDISNAKNKANMTDKERSQYRWGKIEKELGSFKW